MSKSRIAIIVGLLLALTVTVAVFATGFSVVKYTDTSLSGFKPGSVTTTQYIQNGNLTEWDGSYPMYWNVPTPVLTPGWEVHFAMMDYSRQADNVGINNAAGFFFRTGPSGSQYAGMSQQVSPALTTGTYWVQVHITAWENNVESPYNSVAWYGFGTSSDPSSVTEWRELFPDQYVCPNLDGICNHLGRVESVHIDAGAYMHIYMGMKFPDHGAWTVFGVDDITITDITVKEDDYGPDDFIDEGDVSWDPRALR